MTTWSDRVFFNFQHLLLHHLPSPPFTWCTSFSILWLLSMLLCGCFLRGKFDWCSLRSHHNITLPLHSFYPFLCLWNSDIVQKQSTNHFQWRFSNFILRTLVFWTSQLYLSSSPGLHDHEIYIHTYISYIISVLPLWRFSQHKPIFLPLLSLFFLTFIKNVISWHVIPTLNYLLLL